MNFIPSKEIVSFELEQSRERQPIYSDYKSWASGIPDGIMAYAYKTQISVVGVFPMMWGEVEFEQIPAEIFVVTQLERMGDLVKMTAELNRPIVIEPKKIKNHREIY